MKVAVVGGGIFGCTAAWFLARDGFNVDLFEKDSDLLQSASGINQYRLHRGYHYPRSKETILLSKQEEPNFKRTYPEAMMANTVEHYYCIAKEKSFTTALQAQEVWSSCGLEFTEKNLDIVNKDKLAFIAQVKENLFDPHKLRELCRQKLKHYGVHVRLNTKVGPEDLTGYDLVVVATYAQNNAILANFPQAQREYQYEICEKVVLKLPQKFANKSIVIMDGPFMCIDPFGDTGYVVMGNVEHAIHARMVGKKPIIPKQFLSLLNQGIIKNPAVTNITQFLESAEDFFPGINQAEHIGSMYTIRTVPPYRDHDDARPTIVEQVSEKFVTIFSGKVGTCVDVAGQILGIAQQRRASMKMRVGVVGVGRWGKNLVRVFDEIASVAACATTGQEKNSIWLQQKYPLVKHTTNYTDMLYDPSIDAIVVATPIATHYTIAKAALNAGKHLFIEKPLALSVRETQELVALASERQVVLFVGHVFLYHPVFTKLKSLVATDVIEKANFVWNKYGTFDEHLVPNLVSHEASLVLEFFGSLPESVHIHQAQGVQSSLDVLQGTFHFSQQRSCTLEVNRVHETKSKKIQVTTRQGNTYVWESNFLFKLDHNGQKNLIYECKEEPLLVQCQAFLQAIRTRSLPLTDGLFGSKVVEVLEMVQRQLS